MAYGQNPTALDPRGAYDQRALTPEEVLRSERLARITRVFTKIDRVLVGEKIDVTLATKGPAPAWSDGKTVTFNTAEINDLDLAGMVNIHGLNYHEVCHLLYTPRMGSELTTWVLGKGLMYAYNALEDQRIETLLVGRHPATAPYLSAVILRWLAEDARKIAYNYTLVRGRRYLPVEVRSAFRKAFVDQSLIPAIESIVDEYRLLAFPRDNERAKVLIQRFQTEVLDWLPQTPTDSCKASTNTSAGRPVGGQEQEKDSNSAKQQDSESKDEKDSEPSEPKDKGEQDEGEGDEAGQGEGGDEGEDGEGQSASGAGEAGEQAGQDGRGEGQQGQSSKSAGGQSQGGEGESDESDADPESFGGGAGGAGEAGDARSPLDVLKDALEDIHNDQQVQSEMDSRSKSISKPMRDGWFKSDLEKPVWAGTPANASLTNNAKKFQQELRRLREDCEPGWETDQPSGRLSVRRAMQGVDPKEAFDRWTEGNEGADLEVVVLVDASGSMCRRVGGGGSFWGTEANSGAQTADEALWVLTTALKGIGADVTAIAFGSQSFTIYSRDEEKVGKKVLSVNHGGGTDTLPALEEAERIFRSSQRRNRLIIILTDGDWSQAPACDETLRRIEGLGVLSAVAYIDTDGFDVSKAFPRYGHGAQVFGGVSKASDLLPWGKALVTATIKRFGAPAR